MYPLNETNHEGRVSLLSPSETPVDIPRVDPLQTRTMNTNWSPKYLIDPAKHSDFNMSIYQQLSSQSIVVMVLSSYQNYDLR